MLKFRFLLCAIAVSFAVPAAGHAFPTGAPYSGAEPYGECYSSVPLLATCTHDEAAHADGRLVASFSLASRGQAYLPGTGSAYSEGGYIIPFSVSAEADSIRLRAVFRIDDASIAVVRRLGGLAPGPSGSIRVAASLSGPCFACTSGTNVILVDALEPGAYEGQSEIELITTVVGCCDEPLIGDFTAQLFLVADGTLGSIGVGIGSIAAEAHATLIETELTITPAA